MPPPGNCSHGEQQQLQEEVAKACKDEVRTCKGVTDPVLASLYREKNLQCGLARDAINNRCFAGGDLTHRNEAINAWKAAARCEKIIR
ncbi:hypothetical protein [Pseudomonas sp. UFMG81]|uniref:hypothetical protein n=1 Tax=Pseudomonas sp. UFMG81 TaxID=2745936 RepID=UPI001E2CE26E|nr:hypothetical protein [Pseudomonas sp. UFMG81]